MRDPVQRLSCDAVLVTEGDARAIWTRGAEGAWAFDHLWPDFQEHTEILRHIDAGGTVLIFVPSSLAPVRALPEELFPAFTDALGGVVELEVPLVDWLPAQARAQAMRFLADAPGTTGPLALRSPVRVSAPLPTPGNVRVVASASRLASALNLVDFQELAESTVTREIGEG